MSSMPAAHDLQFTIEQKKNFIIILCSHSLGKEKLRDYYKNNRFFRTMLISARINDMSTKKNVYWLVEYDDDETCQSAKIAKRELTDLYAYFYDDKIIMSKCELKI